MTKMKTSSKVYTTLIFIFLYAPIFVLIFFSFNEANSTAVFSGFSLKWYEELFRDTDTIEALKNTLILAVSSSIIATILGTAAAVGINAMRSKHAKNAILTSTNIPMMNPDIVTGVSMMLLFVLGANLIGIKGVLGFPTLLIAHITFNLPYVILSVLPKFRQMDRNLPEAAQDLGCTSFQAFFHVILPSIMPGIVTGLIMAFTLSLDDFVISYFTSGPEFQTLPIRIFSMTKKRVTPDMYALSTILFFVILLLLVLANVSKRKGENNKKEKRRYEMKKIISVLIAVIMVSVLSFSTFAMDENVYKNSGLSGTTLNVYNWGEYISDGAEGSLNVNKKFEEITGIKINYTNYDSNEDMYGKLKSGGASYDVIIPSDYMIERLAKEDMLEKLDFSNIPNYKYIDKKYTGLYFDKNDEYSVPYSVGMVGLIYNKKMVDKAPTSWSIMWDEKYSGQILTFNNPRDAFAIAQFLLKQDINTTKEDYWYAALDKLKEQKPLIKSYVMDDVFNIMERNGAALAPYYAGDFLTMQTNNPDLGFVYPKEGTNIFVDSICIPKTTQNKKAAELYINFLLEPEIALANAETIRYASPNTEVLKMPEYTLKDNEIIYPKDESVYDNVQYFHNLPQESLNLMTTLWDELKIEGNSNTGIYIGAGVAVVAIAGFAIYKAVQKKKREEA